LVMLCTEHAQISLCEGFFDFFLIREKIKTVACKEILKNEPQICVCKRTYILSQAGAAALTVYMELVQ